MIGQLFQTLAMKFSFCLTVPWLMLGALTSAYIAVWYS